MKYKTFHVGLLAYYDEEPKHLPKFGGLVCISATRCRKIGGAKSLKEIQYFRFSLRGARVRYNTDLTVVTSCCVHDWTNCVKNGSVRTKANTSALVVAFTYIFPSSHQGRCSW